jgi:hypothetical protein
MAGRLTIGERKVKRKLICLILATLLAGAALAQEVAIRSDHPDEYIVVKGDTLWDISGRFLEHPWQWPAIWQANQQIENPHLIFPGDVLSLVYIDGQPRLMVDRGRPTIRLSPDARATTRAPIPPIPHEAIEGLIRNMRLFSPEEFDALPYVVANMEQRRLTTDKDRTYARGINGASGEYRAVTRLGSIYWRDRSGNIRRAVDPGYGQHAPTSVEWHPTIWESLANSGGNRGDVVGYEVYQVAEAMINEVDEVSILTIASSQDAVREGDRITPLDDIGYEDQYQPRAMDAVPEGLRVLAVQGDNRLVGHWKMVSINGGARQGIEAGHVFSAFRPGARIRDRVKFPAGSIADLREYRDDFVTLPDEFSSLIMVFRVFDDVSYALVMAGDREVVEGDILKHPDRRL